MAHLSLAAAALSMSLAVQPGPSGSAGGAPPAGPEARYCMHIEAPTGSRIEPVECWTRLEWAEQGVDVDRDWTKEGVAVLG